MKISDQQVTALYAAISEPIMDLRLEYYRSSARMRSDAQDLDKRLFELQSEIWGPVKFALNIEENNNG